MIVQLVQVQVAVSAAVCAVILGAGTRARVDNTQILSQRHTNSITLLIYILNSIILSTLM